MARGLAVVWARCNEQSASSGQQPAASAQPAASKQREWRLVRAERAKLSGTHTFDAGVAAAPCNMHARGLHDPPSLECLKTPTHRLRATKKAWPPVRARSSIIPIVSSIPCCLRLSRRLCPTNPHSTLPLLHSSPTPLPHTIPATLPTTHSIVSPAVASFLHCTALLCSALLANRQHIYLHRSASHHSTAQHSTA